MADQTSRNILRRLKSIEGHVRGVARMVENGDYCVDIVNQVLAIERALWKVNHIVLDRHLHRCVSSAMKADKPEDRERVVREIMEVFKAKGRR